MFNLIYRYRQVERKEEMKVTRVEKMQRMNELEAGKDFFFTLLKRFEFSVRRFIVICVNEANRNETK